MTSVKISSKNQIVAPKEARDRLGVGPGDELLVITKRDRIIFTRKPDNLLEHLAGCAKGVYGDSDEYLRKERASWD